MRSRAGARPRRASAKRASKRSIAAVSPETTVRLGAFSAAISRSSGRSSRTSSPVARTASIVPSGRACMSRARSATSRSASSRVNTPPRHAATYSPTEWPIMLSGSTPSRRHAIARAYSMTNRAGWVTAVCAEPLLRQLFAARLGIEHVAQVEAELRAQDRRALVEIGAEAGIAVVQRRAPSPRTAPPVPGTGRRSDASSTVLEPVSVVAGSSEPSRSMASSVPVATTARRWENRRRPVWSVNATSPSGSAGWSTRWSRRLDVAASRADSDRAERTISCSSSSAAGRGWRQEPPPEPRGHSSLRRRTS